MPDADPDVVTLDVAMEGMDGLAALRGTARVAAEPPGAHALGAHHPGRGGHARGDVTRRGRRHRQGRLQPDGPRRPRAPRDRQDPAVAPGSPRRSAAAPRPVRACPAACPMPRGCALCVIGASTGGPPALQRLLEALPADFPLPVVIAQHMPPGFTRPFAQRLNGLCELRVREAVDGDRVERGTVLIAPAGRHLRITRRLTVAISDEPVGRAAPAEHRPDDDLGGAGAARQGPRHPARPGWATTGRMGWPCCARRAASPSARARKAAWSSGCRARHTNAVRSTGSCRWRTSRAGSPASGRRRRSAEAR